MLKLMKNEAVTGALEVDQSHTRFVAASRSDQFSVLPFSLATPLAKTLIFWILEKFI